MSTKTNPTLAQELEKLLGTSLEAIRRMESARYDELTGSLSPPLVLYGAGGLGRKTLQGLRKIGIEPLAFADNDPALQGRQIDGLAVFAPAQAAQKFGENSIFVIAVYTDSAPDLIESLLQKLSALGCKKIISFVPLYWKYPDLFLPYYVYDLPHKIIDAADIIKEAAKLFRDPISQNEYLGQIKWRLDPQLAPIPPQAEHEIYFPPDLFSLLENEVFVDCGAYTGDTVRSFLDQSLGKFDKILAFEPDPANFKKLKELVDSLPRGIASRIQTGEVALGDRFEELHFNARGIASSSRSEDGGIVIRSEPLDSLLAGEFPTYIKMDIEGAELEALEGATKSIRVHWPILAVSVYHCQDHIWSIPLLVNELHGRYQFYLRRYTPHALDDLVLYAIPESRRRVG